MNKNDFVQIDRDDSILEKECELLSVFIQRNDENNDINMGFKLHQNCTSSEIMATIMCLQNIYNDMVEKENNGTIQLEAIDPDDLDA